MKTNRLIASWGAFCLAAGLVASAPATAFELTDTTGAKHRLADYKGRWVVVNFWATWCTPCVAEIPEIAHFSKDRAKDVVVIGVALDVEDSEEKTKAFARKVGHTYPLVLGDDAVEKQLGKVRGLPTTRIYDPTGKRVYDQLGPVTKKSLDEATGAKPAGKA